MQRRMMIRYKVKPDRVGENEELVKAFDVSRAALTGRLRELGYYRQGGRPDVR